MTALAEGVSPRARTYSDGALQRINTHEAVCAIRYDVIIERIRRLEQVTYWAAASLLASMGGVILTLVWKGH